MKCSPWDVAEESLNGSPAFRIPEESLEDPKDDTAFDGLIVSGTTDVIGSGWFVTRVSNGSM